MTRLSLFALQGIPLIEPGDDLAALIAPHVEAGDVVVIAQKIVSKAEGRQVDLDGIAPSAAATDLAAKVNKDPRFVELVLRESNEVVAHRPGVLIVEHRLGFVMANAGIDRSNVPDGVLLLPVDPDASAARLHEALGVGVVISDTTGRPWRNGIVGFAIGAAGVPSLIDARGTADLHGRPLAASELGHADELAAAASLLMGQAAEGQPIVVIRGLRMQGAPAPARALIRDRAKDLFR